MKFSRSTGSLNSNFCFALMQVLLAFYVIRPQFYYHYLSFYDCYHLVCIFNAIFQILWHHLVSISLFILSFSQNHFLIKGKWHLSHFGRLHYSDGSQSKHSADCDKSTKLCTQFENSILLPKSNRHAFEIVRGSRFYNHYFRG